MESRAQVTRFTDDTFAGLISIVYISIAVQYSIQVYTDGNAEMEACQLLLVNQSMTEQACFDNCRLGLVRGQL